MMQELEPRAYFDLMPLSAVPQLNSRPGAPARIFLDFNGAPAQSWGSYSATTTPAYDTDGDPTTFSQTELNNIQEIYQRVAEKYSSFNINVTTVDPGTYNYNETARMVIGGTGAWSGGTYGGYSYPHGYSGSTSNTGFIFSKNLGSGYPKYVAEATAHEAGHLFGLQHQSSYNMSTGVKLDDYRGGRVFASPNPADPIMGFSYYATRGVWSNGTSISYQTFQDDMLIIGQNNFGWAPDDKGSDRLTAAALNILDGTTASDSGIIETTSDVDYFKFTSTGGLVNITAGVMQYGPTLDLKLSLVDGIGNVLATADTASLGETLVMEVPAGDYYLAVASHGNYGDVGQYTLTGSVVPEPLSAPVILLMGVAWFCQRRDVKGKGRSKFSDREIELDERGSGQES